MGINVGVTRRPGVTVTGRAWATQARRAWRIESGVSPANERLAPWRAAIC